MVTSRSPHWPFKVRTARLELRPYTPKDYAQWVAGYLSSRRKLNRFDLAPKSTDELTKSAYRKILKRQRDVNKTDRGYTLGIFHRRTGIFMGWVDFWIFDRGDSQSANFGYVLLNAFRRQGFGAEAALGAAVAGFRHLKLQRLEAAILPDNLPSRKLIESIGFKFECRRRRCDWERGRWRDKLIYSAHSEIFGLKSRPPVVR